MSRRTGSPNPSVAMPSVPTQSRRRTRSRTLSTAFASPPLQCPFGSRCHGWRASVRRDDCEREPLRSMRDGAGEPCAAALPVDGAVGAKCTTRANGFEFSVPGLDIGVARRDCAGGRQRGGVA